MLLALDDTDGPDGGCTTHTALDVVHRLGLHLRGMPRLVRLNPNCPHKTRGNGAVVLPLATPDGPRVQVGSWAGRPLEAFPEGAQPRVDLAAVQTELEALAAPGADPGLALAAEPLPAAAYHAAVSTQVAVDEAQTLLDASGVSWAGGRGVVGCLGALAWPGPPASYELIGYRPRARWGTPRRIHEPPLRALEDITFHTHDGRLTCVPNTPCPVLLGLRGHEPEPLVARGVPAMQGTGEPVAGWAIWATNQASGDHVYPVSSLAQAPTWGTIRATATITGTPRSGAGGYASVQARIEDERVELVAFEPTGTFRHAVWGLHVGDVVEATGAWAEGTVRLESLRLVGPVSEKVANPVCCDRSMKSRGADGGYKCASCGQTAPEDAATYRAREPGAWEVPVRARRHLHRPLAW